MFEEQHTGVSIAVVLAGTFQYRGEHGRELMTAGALMLGNAGARFECGHEHAFGDRCISFHYSRELFERIAADAGLRARDHRFRAGKLPPLRVMSPLVARAAAATANDLAWEELAVELAAAALRVGAERSSVERAPTADAVARVTESVRAIEQAPSARHSLAQLARRANQSPFHYLRTFERLTGTTPHQFILRSRLRHAAVRLATEDTKVIDVALDCGLNDLSTFNRTFRAEFGMSPGRYARRASCPRVERRA